jgi:hypothetical protein
VPELRVPFEFASPRLVEFHRADWERPGDSYFAPFDRWVQARADWVAVHPGSLGNALVRLRTEFQTQMSLRSERHELGGS